MELPSHSKRVSPNSLGVTGLSGVNVFSQVGSYNENDFKISSSNLSRTKNSKKLNKQHTNRRLSGPDMKTKLSYTSNPATPIVYVNLQETCKCHSNIRGVNVTQNQRFPFVNVNLSPETSVDKQRWRTFNAGTNHSTVYFGTVALQETKFHRSSDKIKISKENYPVHRMRHKISRKYRQQWCRMLWGGRWLTSTFRRSKYLNIVKIQRSIWCESLHVQTKILTFRDTGVIQTLKDQKSIAIMTAFRMYTWLLNYKKSFKICRANHKHYRHYISRQPSMIIFSVDNGTPKKNGSNDFWNSTNRVSDTSRLKPVSCLKSRKKTNEVQSKEAFTSMDVFCPFTEGPNTEYASIPLPKPADSWSPYNSNTNSNFNTWSSEEPALKSFGFHSWSPQKCFGKQQTQITNEFKQNRPVNFNSEVTTSFAGYIPNFLQRLRDAIIVPPQNKETCDPSSKVTKESSTLTTKSIEDTIKEASTSTLESSGTNQSLINLNASSSSLRSVLGTKECSVVTNPELPILTATSTLTSQSLLGKKDCSVSTDPRMLTLAEVQLLSISSAVIDQNRTKNIPETKCFSCQTQNLTTKSVAMEVTPQNLMKYHNFVKGSFLANPFQCDQNTQVQDQECSKIFAIRTSEKSSVSEERCPSMSVKTYASQSTQESSSSSCRCRNSSTTTESADTIDTCSTTKNMEEKSTTSAAIVNKNLEEAIEIITKRLVEPRCQMVKEAKNTDSIGVKKTHSTKSKNTACDCSNSMLCTGVVTACGPLPNLLCISTMTECVKNTTRFANVATSTEENNKVIVMHTKETQDFKIIKLSTGQGTSKTSISNIDVQVSSEIRKTDKLDREVSNTAPPCISKEVQWHPDDFIVNDVTTDKGLEIQFVEPTNHDTKTQLMRAIYQRESESYTSFQLDSPNNSSPTKYMVHAGTSYDISQKSEVLSAINLPMSERTYKNVQVQYETPVPDKDNSVNSERSQLISVFTLCNSYKDMASQYSRTVESSTCTDFFEDFNTALLLSRFLNLSCGGHSIWSRGRYCTAESSSLNAKWFHRCGLNNEQLRDTLRHDSIEQSSFLNPKLFVPAHSKPKVLERYSLTSLVSPDLTSKTSLELLLNLDIPGLAAMVDQETSTTDIPSLQRIPSCSAPPVTNVRSAGVVTSRVILPRGTCSEYFMTNADCLFVYEKPRCILRHQFHADVGIQHYPSRRDIGTKLEVKQEHAVDEYDEVVETAENHIQAEAIANTPRNRDTNSVILLPRYKAYAAQTTVAHERNPVAIIPETPVSQIPVASEVEESLISIKAPSQNIPEESEDIEETVPTRIPAQNPRSPNKTGVTLSLFEKEPKVAAYAFSNDYFKGKCPAIDELNKEACATIPKRLPKINQVGNKLSHSEKTHLKVSGQDFARSKFTCRVNSYEDVPIVEKDQSQNDRLDAAKISTEIQPCHFLPEECSSKFISSIIYDTTYGRRDNNTMTQAVSNYHSAAAIVLKDIATSAIKQSQMSATTSPFTGLVNDSATDPEPAINPRIRQLVLNMETEVSTIPEVDSHQTSSRGDSLMKEEESFSTKLSVDNCLSSPNICGDDKSGLNAVYNTLAAIEGRIRRLKLNMP